MYPGGDVAAGIQAGIDSLSRAGGGILTLDGRIIEVERTIHVRAGVRIDGGWGGFRAAPGFVGSEVVKTENVSLDYSAAGYARATSLINMVIDCARQPGVRGLLQRNVQKDRVTGLRVQNCLADGWIIEGGYELFGLNFEMIAATRRDGGIAPAGGCRGLVCLATDCHFADGITQYFAIGVHSPGAHNHFTRLHAWSTYHTADPAMLFGFLDEGEGNTFIACNADSPRLGDNTKPPNRENGGYGFFGDTHSMNRRIIACTVQLSQFGDATSLPPANTIIPVYCGQVRNTVLGLEVRDYGRAGFGPYVVARSANIMRETTILGGNIHEGLPVNLYLPGLDVAPFVPSLMIGGRGNSAYQAEQHGFAKRLGGVIVFEIHLRLTSKGTARGPLSIDGLPEAALASQGNRRVVCSVALESWANREPILAVLRSGSSTLHLVKQFSGEPATHLDLTDTSQITVNGQYITHTLTAD
jgi:hypothetical protein